MYLVINQSINWSALSCSDVKWGYITGENITVFDITALQHIDTFDGSFLYHQVATNSSYSKKCIHLIHTQIPAEFGPFAVRLHSSQTHKNSSYHLPTDHENHHIH